MARASTVKTALILFTKDQEENCEKLRTVLESESNGDIIVKDLADICARGLSLEHELCVDKRWDCIVLICCPRAAELIDNETSSVFTVRSGQEVTFDGKAISKALKDNNGNLRRKFVPVSFVKLPSVLHGAGGHRGRCSAISFEIKQKEITEEMLEGDVLESLIDVIKKT